MVPTWLPRPEDSTWGSPALAGGLLQLFYVKHQSPEAFCTPDLGSAGGHDGSRRLRPWPQAVTRLLRRGEQSRGQGETPHRTSGVHKTPLAFLGPVTSGTTRMTRTGVDRDH